MSVVRRLPGFLATWLLLGWASAHGASGTWTNPNGGSWTNPANWAGGTIADGLGAMANFSTLSLAADASITLDGPRTIGNLSFDDKSAVKHNWRLVPGTGGTLTLAGTTPTFTVLSATTRVETVVAGAPGLAKSGAGRLVLAALNTYTGSTLVNAGVLELRTVTFSTQNPLSLSAPGSAEITGTLNLDVNTSSTALAVNGPGWLRLAGVTNHASQPDVYFGPNHSGNTCYGARISAPVDLGSLQRYVHGKTGHNGVGPYGTTGADCQFAGSISGAGGLTFVAQNTWTDSGPMEVPFALNASNSFSGPVEIRRGSVYLGHSQALTRTNTLRFDPAAGHNARLFLYGKNLTISDLGSAGAGSALIANGNLRSGATVTLSPVTLTVEQGAETTFAGTLTDVYPEYPGSGSGTTGPLSLTKRGPGLLRLAGASDYTGATTVSGGTLEVNGTLGASPVTVLAGAVLSGKGALNGAVTVEAAGALAPGTGGIEILTINHSLTLGGTTRMKLSKTGTALANDLVTGIATLRYGGSLVVTNIGDVRTGALSAGESFVLFSAATYASAFSDLSLPELSAGLAWDPANLNVNGSITVVGEAAAPVLARQPASVAAVAGSPARFDVVAAGIRPLSYQWLRNGTPLPGATSSRHDVSNVTSNDAAGYSVVVTNAYGSVTSSVASLTVIPAGMATPVTNGLMVYLNFDNNLSAQGGTTNHGVLYTGGATAGPRYKPGVIGQAATFANAATGGQPTDWAVTLGNLEWLYAGSFTVSLWERTTVSGDGALAGNKNWTSGANIGWVISSLEPKNVNWNAVGGTRRDVNLNPPFSDGAWHLVTVTFDRQANRVTSYVDGVAVNASDISPSGAASFNAGFPTLVGSSGNGTYSGTGDVDDFALWNRVLTSDEVAGIYGAGLAGRPLTLAAPAIAPVIVSQPASTVLAAGRSATFSVAASGAGPFFYQWRLNGTNIVGATNATYTIPSIGAVHQGVYTVLVSNGSGALVSSAATLTVYDLAVTGQWDFDQGDLRATVGADAEFFGDGADTAAFPFLNINQQPARVLAIGSTTGRDGLYLRHGAKPNGGGFFVNQYSLVLDLLFPTSSSGSWRALLQTDPFNHDGNDADFYIGGSSSLPQPNGVGAEGQFDGSLAPNQWYRVALVVDLTAGPGEQLVKYVNGVKVGSQSLAGGVDGRYALGPAAILFVTGLGSGLTQPGFVNSVQFVNGCLSPAAIAAMGTPEARGLPAGNAAVKIVGFAQNGTELNLAWTGPDGRFRLQQTGTLANPLWQTLATFTNQRTVTVPVPPTPTFYRVEQPRNDILVGPLPFGEQSLPSKQIVRASGQQAQFPGRPVDLVLSPDGKRVFVKNINNLVVIDAETWKILQTVSYPGSGASMHGIAVNPAGTRVYVTGSGNELYEYAVATNGAVSFARTIAMPGGSYPCGVRVSNDGSKAYVCLSVANRLAVVNLSGGTVLQQIPVGIAPWDVALSPDGATAYVSDWGGRFPLPGEKTAFSAGTMVVVDDRGVASNGAVSVVNLAAGAETAKIETGLHPCDLELNASGSTLYVANANSDTVTVIDTASRSVRETILVRPDAEFPYGSASGGLALSKDEKLLFVASAGNNAIAQVRLAGGPQSGSIVEGFLPTDWYPGAVLADSNHLYVVNVKGLGSRLGQSTLPGGSSPASWQIGSFLGTATRLRTPSADALAKHTAQAFEDGRVPHIRHAHQPGRPGRPPVPVPGRVGEPSVFKHVLYILKENKTYDQLFGDLPQGNGDPNLCIYPRLVSPNHHALAERYVLLDNFYCNGVNSSDGHSWSTEGNSGDHLEKAFGGFSRSYTFGDDPLTYSSTGFIWNNVLRHGLSFRNYGEMDYASPWPTATWLEIYDDYVSGTDKIGYVQNIGIASLLPYSSTNVPGWNMSIPDVVRAKGFIKELQEAQAKGQWADFHLLYLPNDHTGGPPTPRAQVADNDLALGQVVEAVSKSIFWTNTAIFVIEDDPQSGYDHVDGHRSICLVISPYTRRGEVISTFYNQAGVLHTMERILGLPPMNQQDAMAPIMFECFTNSPDFSTYTALPANISLTEGVRPAKTAWTPQEKAWAERLSKMDFSRPDRINDDLFNRYVWFMNKGQAPYPVEFVGAHGKGLRKLGLKLDRQTDDDDD